MCFRTEPGRGPSFQGYHGGCRPIRPAPTAHAYYPRRSYRASRAKSMRPRLGCCADRWCAADSAPATLPHLDQNFAVEGGYEPPADSAETSRLPAPNVTWYGAPCVQGDFCVTTFLRYPHPLLATASILALIAAYPRPPSVAEMEVLPKHPPRLLSPGHPGLLLASPKGTDLKRSCRKTRT